MNSFDDVDAAKAKTSQSLWKSHFLMLQRSRLRKAYNQGLCSAYLGKNTSANMHLALPPPFTSMVFKSLLKISVCFSISAT